MCNITANTIAYISYIRMSLSIFYKAAILCLVLIISACSAENSRYIENGIGPELYSADLQRATLDQEIYFGFICKQAGIPSTYTNYNYANSRTAKVSYPKCAYPEMDVTQWTILVNTGFNDIDRRCDSYLAWVETLRNQHKFWNSSLARSNSFSKIILQAALPDAAKAIAIVGDAFGFGQDIFTNYQQMILPGVERSTIKVLVTERRIALREAAAKVAVKYKPDAVNLLQAYLRICMPHVITMDINSYARLSASGILASTKYADADRVVGNTVEKTVRTAEDHATNNEGSGRQGPNDGDKNVVAMFGAKSGRTLNQVKLVQGRLCVNPNGKVLNQTKTAIAIFRRSNFTSANPSRDEIKQHAALGGDSPFARNDVEFNQIKGLKKCIGTNFINTYEHANFSKLNRLTKFVEKLQCVFPEKIFDDPIFKQPTVDKFSYKSKDGKYTQFRTSIQEIATLLKTQGYYTEKLFDERPHITFHFDNALDNKKFKEKLCKKEPV